MAPQFQLVFKNCGQTPAYKGRYWTDIQVHEVPLTSDLVASEKKTIVDLMKCLRPQDSHSDISMAIVSRAFLLSRLTNLMTAKSPFTFSVNLILSTRSANRVVSSFDSDMKQRILSTATSPFKKLAPISNITTPTCRSHLKHGRRRLLRRGYSPLIGYVRGTSLWGDGKQPDRQGIIKRQRPCGCCSRRWQLRAIGRVPGRTGTRYGAHDCRRQRPEIREPGPF
jgi:hypothetical protein